MEQDVNLVLQTKYNALEKRLDEELQKTQEYEEEIQVLYEVIKTKDEVIEKLQEKLHMLEASQATKKPTKKRRRISEECNFSNVSESTVEDRINHPRIEKLKEINEELDTQFTEEEAIIEVVDRSIEKRFEEMKQCLINVINEKMIVNNVPTYASALSGNDDKTEHDRNMHGNINKEYFKSIVMDAKNDEAIEKKDQEKRAANVIIHGKVDTSSRMEDNGFVMELLAHMETNVSPTGVMRIGEYKEGKNRPIKLTFLNVREKNKFMQNLRNIKGKEQFKGISIRDDYTIAERNMIKEFVTRAKERNNKDGERYIWKVRGNPKRGLFLKRFLSHSTDTDVERNHEDEDKSSTKTDDNSNTEELNQNPSNSNRSATMVSTGQSLM